MIEFITGFIGKTLGWLIPTGWKYALKRWFRPSIETRKAPENIFEHISPGASKDHIKELLGSPHRIYEDIWAYRFRDALVQIEFWPSGGAKHIALALTLHSPKHGFKLPMLEKPLGKISLADAMEDEGELQHRYSLRTEEIIWLTRIGSPGAWINYTFGALSPLTPGYMADTVFSWDRDEDKLITSPSDVHINWIALSDSMDEIYFDWSLALPGIQ